MKKPTVAILSILVLSAILALFSYLGKPPIIQFDLAIVDESGYAIAGAHAETSSVIFNADHNGNARIVLRDSGPDVLLVSAKGYLTETVPVGWANNHQRLEVKLLSNAGGKRTVIHFGGDLMLGRRYLSLETNGLPSTPTNTTEGAVEIVKSLYRSFSSADLSCLNLETIIGDFNQNEAVSGKKYLLQSPPESAAALHALGVDLVSMANNHSQDWGDQGIDSTMEILRQNGISAVGAGDAQNARLPVILERNGNKIGTLAYSSILNVVDPLSLKFVSEWDSVRSINEIKDLRNKVDVLVVQLHSSYQYETAPSFEITREARAAIDAGADIVISHHPHVSQGMEWYKGHLIVYSLGNLVFDQNFSDTFSSGYLRTVWEGGLLIEARYIPIEIVNYRPIISTDDAARKNISQIWERSINSMKTLWGNGLIYTVLSPRNIDSKPVQFLYEWGTARLGETESKSTLALAVKPGEIIKLDSKSLIPARLGLSPNAATDEVLIGRDLFGWGQFEDTLADAIYFGGAHITMKQPEKQWLYETNTLDHNGYILLTRSSKNKSTMLIRTVSRIPLVPQRLYAKSVAATGSAISFSATGSAIDYRPVDPKASYSVRLRIKTKGPIIADLRVDSYWFYDAASLENPESEILGQNRYKLPSSEGNWQTIDIPLKLITTNNKEANAVLIYIELHPPLKGSSKLEIDDFEVIEWRDASLMPDIYGAYTHVKNIGSTGLNLDCQVVNAKK